jgi:hypothetical protein
MCVDRAHVAEVFNIFKRYLWITGYSTLGITRVGFINQTLYFGPVKLYERGSDGNKRKRKAMLWRPWQLDRVRLELSASYDQLHLRGLTSTSAFIDNPLFKDMLYSSDGLMFRFARFKDGAQDVPHEWEEYPPRANPNANLGQCFQEQYKDLASAHAEPHKKVQSAEGFDDLIDLIHVAIQNFSMRWQHDLAKLG